MGQYVIVFVENIQNHFKLWTECWLNGSIYVTIPLYYVVALSTEVSMLNS